MKNGDIGFPLLLNYSKVTNPVGGYRPRRGLEEADFAKAVTQSILEIEPRCEYVK